jgi:NAD(P)-dependent dehydrogenase (short-subunit alcohol dehydrogenase family)
MSDAPQRLAGRVVVVTGAGSGIGRAVARRLAREGAVSVCADIDSEAVHETAQRIEADGGSARAAVCDVSVEHDVTRLMALAADAGGPHAVVCNAGVQNEDTVLDTEPEDWDRIMAVNVRSAYLCARAAIPRMRRLGGGSIVNMASVVGFWVEPSLAAYSVSKGALITLTRTIAVDFGAVNIRCNCICPGYIDTGMPQRYFDLQPDPEAARTAAARMHSLRRLGTAEEVAAMAAFLVSDESSFCTGQPFVVDGGLSAGAQIGMVAG